MMKLYAEQGGNDTKQRNEKRIGCGLRLGLGFCVLLIYYFILDLIRTPNTSTSTRRRTGRRRRGRREINEKKKRQRIVRGFERPYCPSVVFFFSRWTISGSGGGKRACWETGMLLERKNSNG